MGRRRGDGDGARDDQRQAECDCGGVFPGGTQQRVHVDPFQAGVAMRGVTFGAPVQPVMKAL
jgi:hypothetical protein